MGNARSELFEILFSLNLSTIAQASEEVAIRAAKEGLSHEEFLLELVKREKSAREARRVARLLKAANLPSGKQFQTLEMSLFHPEVQQHLERLRNGDFLREATNILAIGKPGTGKSHLASAIGHALIEKGVPVWFTSTANLVQKLLAAKRDLRLPQELAKLDRFEFLILDDIGYVQHDRDEMEVLFTVFSERYERKSLMITTNLVFSEWEQIFKNPMTTLAAIDRIVHHSVIIDLMETESYRAKAAGALRTQNEDGGKRSSKAVLNR